MVDIYILVFPTYIVLKHHLNYLSALGTVNTSHLTLIPFPNQKWLLMTIDDIKFGRRHEGLNIKGYKLIECHDLKIEDELKARIR